MRLRVTVTVHRAPRQPRPGPAAPADDPFWHGPPHEWAVCTRPGCGQWWETWHERPAWWRRRRPVHWGPFRAPGTPPPQWMTAGQLADWYPDCAAALAPSDECPAPGVSWGQATPPVPSRAPRERL